MSTITASILETGAPSMFSLLPMVYHPSGCSSNGQQPSVLDRYVVLPTSLLKSPIINRGKTWADNPGLARDHQMRLEAEAHKLENLLKLNHSMRRKLVAEEEVIRNQWKETHLMVLASKQMQTLTSHSPVHSQPLQLEPQLAMELARATQSVMMKEYETAQRRLDECHQMMKTLEDAKEEAGARVEDAVYQFGRMLRRFQDVGIWPDNGNDFGIPSLPVYSCNAGNSPSVPHSESEDEEEVEEAEESEQLEESSMGED